MTICREWSLVKRTPDRDFAKCLKCRSWGCEECAEDRKRGLVSLAWGGQAERFITLTVNPAVGRDQLDRLRLVTRAFRIIVERLRKERGRDAIQYLVVVEATKRGEPHLHILARCGRIEKSWLSACLEKLTGAFIVDIQKVRGKKHVATYVAKYIAKQPAQFAGSKRYWKSAKWDLRDDDYQPSTPPEYPWQIDERSLYAVSRDYARAGIPMRALKPGSSILVAIPARSPP